MEEYLFHYTNIETLALILKNHTIRFNSLDKMDDLQENETADIRNVGQFCYISSWTGNIEENIPMWNMYTSIFSGIRIRMKKMPFRAQENRVSDIEKVIKQKVNDESGGHPFKSLIPVAEMFKRGFISHDAISGKILYKVEYTSDKEKLYPKLVTYGDGDFNIALGKLGKFKNVHWTFQNEWRYILTCLPLDINQVPDKVSYDAQMMVNKILKGLEKQPFPFYDLYIDDNAFKDMEITLSPKISLGNREIVKLLVEKYNPSAKIRESELVGLL